MSGRVLYPRARRSAYYILSRARFLVLGERGELELSTCPHRATLLTSSALAKRVLEDVRKLPGHEKAEIYRTATHEDNVVVGDPLRRS